MDIIIIIIIISRGTTATTCQEQRITMNPTRHGKKVIYFLEFETKNRLNLFISKPSRYFFNVTSSDLSIINGHRRSAYPNASFDKH